jgi:hypothetical protein
VCGFDYDKAERQKFEPAWQNAAAARMTNENSRSIEGIILAAADIIQSQMFPYCIVRFAQIEANANGVNAGPFQASY